MAVDILDSYLIAVLCVDTQPYQHCRMAARWMNNSSLQIADQLRENDNAPNAT